MSWLILTLSFYRPEAEAQSPQATDPSSQSSSWRNRARTWSPQTSGRENLPKATNKDTLTSGPGGSSPPGHRDILTNEQTLVFF